MSAVASHPIGDRLSLWLDAGRWISAWVVVFGHVRAQVFMAREHEATRSLLADVFYAVSGLGTYAVMVFFVLSGFLIAGRLDRGELSGKRLLTYAVDRISRLWIVLLPGLLLAVVLYAWRAAYGIFGDPIWDFSTFGLVANVFFLQTIAAPAYGDNSALWSIANELWYYVAFPVLLFLRRGGPWVRLIAIGMLLLWFGLVGQSIALLFLVWLAGVAAFRMPPPRHAWWRLTIPIFLALLIFARSNLLALDFTQIPVGLAMAWLLWSVRAIGSSGTTSVLSRSLHRGLASWSFSLYVVHMPLMITCSGFLTGSAWQLAQSIYTWQAWGMFLLLWVVSLLGGFLFALLTERHTRHVRGWMRRLVGLDCSRH